MTCYYANLDHEALLHVQGPDALSFLQGQVTCDTRSLRADLALPGACCTVQGRVVFDFLLGQLEADHLVLRMRRDILASSAALLAKYIVFSKAQLSSGDNGWRVLAVWGPQAVTLLQGIFGAAPAGRFASCHGDGFLLVQTDAAGQQFECYLQDEVVGDMYRQLQSAAQSGSESDWQALQLAAGVARIETATSGEYVPQMLNYDLTGHISFRKGCYTGQEVVARLHYRGKPKRRLYLARIDADQLPDGRLPAPGSPLYKDGTSQAAGNVINSMATVAGPVLLLVTATTDSLDGTLQLLSTQGPELHISAVPYAVPENK